MRGEVEMWIAELEAAGWTRYKGMSTVWQVPNGEALYRGPYGAWHAMKEFEKNMRTHDGKEE